MIRHVVLIDFDGADESVVDAVITRLRGLPGLIPEIADYTVGRDLGLTDGPPSVVVIGDFATVEDYRAYSANADHRQLIEELIGPNASAINRAQIEI